MSVITVRSATLADRFWPAERPDWVRAALLVLVGTGLLTLSAKVAVPFHPVPMTLQTLVVLLLGVAYGPRLAVITVLAYCAQGVVGLPVFTNTPPQVAGPLYFAGPTAGFLMGFVVAALVAGVAAERGQDRSLLRLVLVLATADALLLACGWAWLAYGFGLGAERAFAVGVSPFLLGEAVKVALASALPPALWALRRGD